MILHANSYKDPSHYKVSGNANLMCVFLFGNMMVSLLSFLFSWLMQGVSHWVNSIWISNSVKFYVIVTQNDNYFIIYSLIHFIYADFYLFIYLHLYGKDLSKHYLKHPFMVFKWHYVNNEFSFLGELYLYFILKVSHACLWRLAKYLWIWSNYPTWLKYGGIDGNTVFYVSLLAAVHTELSSHFCYNL